MFNADYEKEVAEVARDLWQEGVRTLHWSAGPGADWFESWADVYIREFCEALQAGWLATIVSPEDEEPEGYGYFHIPHDGHLRIRFGQTVAAEEMTLLLPGKEPKNIEIEKDLREESPHSQRYWSQYRQSRFASKDPGIYLVPVWSADLIAETVAEWIERISGLRFRLIVNEDVLSPFYEEVQQAAEEVISGEVELFDLGDGVKASERAMDSLLADPEAAAEILEQIKNSRRQ